MGDSHVTRMDVRSEQAAPWAGKAAVCWKSQDLCSGTLEQLGAGCEIEAGVL